MSQSADISLCASRIRSLRLLSECSWSRFHRLVKQICDVLESREPGEMVRLGGGSVYCISAETARIRSTTHGLPNLLALVWDLSILVTHCHESVTWITLLSAGWYKCWITECPGQVYICVVFGGSEFKLRFCTATFYCLLALSWVGQSLLAILKVIRPESFPNVFLQLTTV